MASKPYENKLMETKSDYGRKKHMLHTMRFFNDASRLMGYNDVEGSDDENQAVKSPLRNKTERDSEVTSQFLANKWNLCYSNGLMNARKNRGKSEGRSFTQKPSVADRDENDPSRSVIIQRNCAIDLTSKNRGTSYLVAPINVTCSKKMSKIQQRQQDFLNARNTYYLKLAEPK